MTYFYREITNARLVIAGKDATYGVQFDQELVTGKKWEFDRMSDAITQKVSYKTDNIRVRLNPVKNTMQFPDDAKRECEYLMSVENARSFFKFLTQSEPNFWFALDMAHQARNGKLAANPA